MRLTLVSADGVGDVSVEITGVGTCELSEEVGGAGGLVVVVEVEGKLEKKECLILDVSLEDGTKLLEEDGVGLVAGELGVGY